jgi:hypothetical protein
MVLKKMFARVVRHIVHQFFTQCDQVIRPRAHESGCLAILCRTFHIVGAISIALAHSPNFSAVQVVLGHMCRPHHNIEQLT